MPGTTATGDDQARMTPTSRVRCPGNTRPRSRARGARSAPRPAGRGSRWSPRGRGPRRARPSREAGPAAVHLPPRTPPPITNETLAWPWSVPRLPFSRTVRPNSVRVTSTTSRMRSPRSRWNAASAWPSSRRRCGELALHAALGRVVVPAADLGEGDLDARRRPSRAARSASGSRRSGRAGRRRPRPGRSARDRPSSGTRWPRRSPARCRAARRAPRPRTCPRSRGPRRRPPRAAGRSSRMSGHRDRGRAAGERARQRRGEGDGAERRRLRVGARTAGAGSSSRRRWT